MLFGKLKSLASWDKLFYTFYLVLSNGSYGCLFTLFPNILVDMKFILNTTTSLISLYTTVETVGYILGTLVGLSYKRLNRQIVIGLLYVMLTIASAVLPMAPNLWLLYLCGFLFGFGGSAYVSGQVAWLMDMWGSSARPFCPLVVGSLLSTIIIKPYLVGDISQDVSTNGTSSFNQDYNIFNKGNDPNDIDRRSRLIWPVLIIGLCILSVPISSLIMYFIKPYKTTKEESKQVNEDLSAEQEIKLFDRPETPRKTIRVLFAFWFTLYITFETVFLKFAVTYYQYSPHKLPAQEAAHIFSIATAVYTAFRGLNVFIGLKLSIRSMLCYHYVVLIVGTFLLIVGQNILSVLWVSSVLLCWGFSAMFAGIYTFTGTQLTVTNQLSTLFILLKGVFTLVTPVLIGEYLDNYSEIFIFVEIFYLLSSLVFIFLIIYLIRRYKRIVAKTIMN